MASRSSSTGRSSRRAKGNTMMMASRHISRHMSSDTTSTGVNRALKFSLDRKPTIFHPPEAMVLAT